MAHVRHVLGEFDTRQPAPCGTGAQGRHQEMANRSGHTSWSRDAKHLLYQDQLGDENFNVYAIDPSVVPDPKTGDPAVRNVIDAEESRVMIYAVPKTDPDILHIGLNDRDKVWHDQYKLRISSGERTLLRRTPIALRSRFSTTRASCESR